MTLPEYYNGTSWIPVIGTVTSVGITGSTGLGVTGSPITSAGTINLTLGSELQALSAFASTGLIARTGSNTYSGRTLTQGTGISITNGDGISGNPIIGLGTINLTGAVIGSGTNSISTTLNSTQTMSGTSLGLNWSNSGSFAEYSINHYLQDSTPPPQFVETIQAGTYAANTYRWWNLIFQPGLSSTPSGNFQIDFVHNISGRQTPFRIIRSSSNFTTYINSVLDVSSNQIVNLANPSLANDAVNKNYADTSTITPSRISGYPSNSSLFLNGFGSWTAPSFSNLITTSNSIYDLTINNTNTSSTATDLLIQNNGNFGVAFGFNNSTNEAYMWGYGTANLKFGTNSTKRMQLLNNGTLDLMTNDLITTGNINAQTGTLKGNNLAAYNSGSILVINPLAMNNNYITGLANPVNPQDAATKSYADSVGSGTNKSILHGYNAATYSVNVGVGDHLKFDSFAFARGTAITLDTSSSYNTSTGTASIGRITLAAGKTYKLTGSINNVVSASYNATRWYNSDTNTALGLISGSPSPISTTDRAPSAETVAYVFVSSTTRVELRITWNAFSSVNGTGDAIGTAWFTAEEV